MRGSSLKAKPHPGSIRKEEEEENIGWKRKGRAFSRFYTCSFIFRIPKCQTSFSKVDLPTKRPHFFFNYYFISTTVSSPCHESKQSRARAGCIADTLWLVSYTQGNVEANNGKTLCEHSVMLQVKSFQGSLQPLWSQGRKWKRSSQTITPQHLSWHPGTQEHRATPSRQLRCRIILLCYRSCKKQMYVE